MQRSIAILLLIGPLLYELALLSYAQNAASYPTVDRATQRARDEDRRHILESELHAERQALDKAQAALSAGPTPEHMADVHRHLENIKSLQRELESVTGKQEAPREPLRLVAKAGRPAASSPRSTNGTTAFWNPYNRAPDPEVKPDFSTTPRRDLP